MLGVCVLATTVVTLAQTVPADEGTFEVATLKQNNSGERGGGIRRLPGGRVTVTNISARALVGFAYGAQGPFLTGGPGWMNDDKYDITAKMEGNPEWGGIGTDRPDPITIAMRKLLADRFKLKLHKEMRELDAYALVMVKPGTPGPSLEPSSTDCKAFLEQARQGKLPPPPGPPDYSKPLPCSIMGRFGQLLFDGFPMAQAAGMFMNQAGRPIVDRTGLTGNWQFIVTFAQERPVGAPAPPNEQALPDPNAPSFFTAIQEQLGLKLEATKAPFEVTVIDSAEHPTDD
jgi:uncharacterized protein (TIGR03435 family)